MTTASFWAVSIGGSAGGGDAGSVAGGAVVEGVAMVAGASSHIRMAAVSVVGLWWTESQLRSRRGNNLILTSECVAIATFFVQ